MNPESGRAYRLRTAVVVAAMTTAAVLVPSMATASHQMRNLFGSNFEIDLDANLKVDDTGRTDWANVPTAELTVKGDAPTGQNDDSFGQGSKEDTAVPSPVNGSIPNNKSDLLNFGFYLEKAAGAQEFLHLFWHRVQEPTGTTNMDFEFNKNAVSGPNAVLSSNGVTPVRSNGDLLVQYDLSQGGVNPTIHLSRWLGDSSYEPTLACEAANSRPCWSEKVQLTDSVITSTTRATGSINSSEISTSEASPLTGPISVRTFGEATLDWDALTGTGCTSFGSAYLKSRSSDSFTAALKDYIAPINTGFDRCGSIRWTKVDSISGVAVAGATFEVCKTRSYSPATSTFTVLAEPYSCFSVADRTSAAGTSRDTNPAGGAFQVDGLELGTYRLEETAAPTGYDPVNPSPLPTIDVTSASVFPPSAAPVVFTNNPRMKIIVIACNTVTERLVDATVGLNSDLDANTALEEKATLTTEPSFATEAQLCGLGGANYDNLRWGTYGGTVEVPDVAPTFP